MKGVNLRARLQIGELYCISSAGATLRYLCVPPVRFAPRREQDLVTAWRILEIVLDLVEPIFLYLEAQVPYL